MIALAVDENFNNRVIRGLLRRNPQLSMVRVQDVGLSGVPDDLLLNWAADARRVLVTHDATTMVDYAQRRVAAGSAMCGIIVCYRKVPIGIAIDDLLLIAECSVEREWDNQVLFLPL